MLYRLSLNYQEFGNVTTKPIVNHLIVTLEIQVMLTI
jgi:hypothetical protein